MPTTEQSQLPNSLAQDPTELAYELVEAHDDMVAATVPTPEWREAKKRYDELKLRLAAYGVDPTQLIVGGADPEDVF